MSLPPYKSCVRDDRRYRIGNRTFLSLETARAKRLVKLNILYIHYEPFIRQLKFSFQLRLCPAILVIMLALMIKNRKMDGSMGSI